MKKILLLTLLIFPLLGFGQNPNAWINEIHYDDPGTDVNEFVEIIVQNPGSYDLSLLKLELYNGSGGVVYDTKTVDLFTVGSTNGTFTYYTFTYPTNGIQNGAPDGMALSYNGTLIQFLSYEGTFTGSGGAANGVTSTDIGVSETNSDPSGVSLQLIGTGSQYSNFTWTGPTTSSKGSINSGETLPISLTSFTGKAVDKNILLNWNTASEENNNYFDIQHSADGKTFTSIGKVSGAGTSKVSKDYSYVDENPYAGTTYYKLVQHDFDGKTSESKVIGVASNISAACLSVYATSSDVKITLSSPNRTTGTFEVFDIGGRRLSATSLAVNKGYNTISIPVSLQPGVHFVRYTSEGVVNSVKFMR